MVIGQDSAANGKNGHEGGLTIGAGSNANGGDVALDGGNTASGRGFADGSSTYPGCNIVVDHECFNQPGR